MNEQNVNREDFQASEESSINLNDIFRIVVSKWYGFVISVAVCIVAAIIYLMWTPVIYERIATVLIKDDKTGSKETAIFQDLAIFDGKSNVNNEMIVFKSYSLMAEAVRRLKLDVSYTVKEKLRMQELYTNSPVTFTFEDIEDTQWITFNAKLLQNNEIALWDFKTTGMENEHTIVVSLNDTVNTPVGRMVATPTLWYNEMWYDKPVTITKSNVKTVINYYRNALTVSLADKQTSVVNLSIKDESVQRAEDLLNTVIAIYNENAINDKNQMAVNTENFINERLIIIEEELGDVDRQIQVFKTENQLTDIRSDAQLALQESSESDREIIRLQNQHSMATYIRKYLSEPSNSTELIPANTGVDDIKLEGQILNYNETLLKRNHLIENSSERNPVVQELNNSLNSMRQNIMRAVDNLIVNLDIQSRSIRARTARTRARISAVPQQQTKVTSIGREQQIKEQLYLYLLNKREENAINKAMMESTARIIDAATGSAIPVAPRKVIILTAALLLGLAIPSAILYLIMLSDITVRGQKDLRNVLTIPFLGEVPFKKSKAVNGIDAPTVVVRESGRDPLSESFRIIRTNMDFMRVKQDDMKVIMTTSTNVGSGKTFIASNLAVSIAMTEKKVLLIDMDIRKGTLGRGITIHKNIDGYDIGLTSYLSRIVSKVESLIIQDEDYPKIDIIRSGPVPPNPAELLLSPRLDELINILRDKYEYIIIDNVPAGLVADTLISNRVADLTLYIIRAGKMDRRMLPDIEQLYREEKLKNMAVILNGVGAGIGYGYGYGYSYGYGYGNDSEGN
ncbi:MAG: polysaccharide biosynthesis tyrosine autokinase [Tannerella sp.]|jgi:capsular exopolysaccharide synthesis family protein|nr:polysaccharide biosynthesis tyrosine autokinase [Tannerella sp.]